MRLPLTLLLAAALLLGQTRLDAPTQVRYMTGRAYYGAGLDFGVIPGQSCAERSFPAAGVWTGDWIAPGWPALLPVQVTGMMYGADGVIVVRLCNATGTSVVVASSVFSAIVARP
jgi:hypothetical protein